MLEMKDCNKLLKLPQSIGQLSQLKCLRVYADRFSMLQCLEDTALDWIRNLTSLEELCLLNVSESSNFVNDLGKLIELRKLCIVSLRLKSASLIKDWEESLAKLQKIQVIDIGWFIYKEEGDATYCREGYVPPRQLRVLHMQYKQPGLPIKISPSLQPNLSHLLLQVNAVDVEIFGRFPELVTLQLDVNTYHYDVTGAPGAFPKLRAFKTDGTPRFLGVMPNLEYLEFVVSVMDLNTKPDFGSLVNLPMLRRVVILVWYNFNEFDSEEAKDVVREAIFSGPSGFTFELKTY